MLCFLEKKSKESMADPKFHNIRPTKQLSDRAYLGCIMENDGEKDCICFFQSIYGFYKKTTQPDRTSQKALLIPLNNIQTVALVVETD